MGSTGTHGIVPPFRLWSLFLYIWIFAVFVTLIFKVRCQDQGRSIYDSAARKRGCMGHVLWGIDVLGADIHVCSDWIPSTGNAGELLQNLLTMSDIDVAWSKLESLTRFSLREMARRIDASVPDNNIQMTPAHDPGQLQPYANRPPLSRLATTTRVLRSLRINSSTYRATSPCSPSYH